MAEAGGEAGHGQAEVGELEELERELVLDGDGQVAEAVIEVVALAVAQEDVGELGVVDVVYLEAGLSNEIVEREEGRGDVQAPVCRV